VDYHVHPVETGTCWGIARKQLALPRLSHAALDEKLECSSIDSLPTLSVKAAALQAKIPIALADMWVRLS